jgi:hypothetical protein
MLILLYEEDPGSQKGGKTIQPSMFSQSCRFFNCHRILENVSLDDAPGKFCVGNPVIWPML